MPIFLTKWLRERSRGYCLLLAGSVLALYLPFLGNPFFFDDIPFFSQVSSTYSAATTLLTPRGIPYSSLLWTRHWFGGDLPHAYRLVDAVLHAATSITLFFLLRRLLSVMQHSSPTSSVAALRHGSCAEASSRAIPDFAAAATALIFAVHPVATYTAGYVMQRSIVMSTLFSMLCLLAFLHALISGNRRWLALAVVAYFLAAFSKEHAVGLPMLVGAITVMMRAQWWSRRDGLLPALALTAIAMGAIAILLVLRLRGVIGAAYEPMAAHMFAQTGLDGIRAAHLLSIATQAGLFFKYLLLWLVPIPGWMSVDMREPFIVSWANWKAWAGPVSFLLYGAVSIRLLSAGGLLAIAGFGLLYPWLMFLVEFSSIRVQETFVLYRSYIWMPGLMLVLAVLLVQLQRMLVAQGRMSLPVTRMALLVLPLALLIPAAVDRLQVASDPWRLWDGAAKLLADDAVPGAERILYNRGNAALAAGRAADAVSDLERVVRLRPNLYQVHQALGLAQYANNQIAAAEASFRRARAIKPDNPALLYAHAVTLRRMGRVGESIEAMIAGCAAKSQPACYIVERMRAEQGLAVW